MGPGATVPAGAHWLEAWQGAGSEPHRPPLSAGGGTRSVNPPSWHWLEKKCMRTCLTMESFSSLFYPTSTYSVVCM